MAKEDGVMLSTQGIHQRSHGELLGVEMSVKYTPGRGIGWNVRQLSLVSNHEEGCWR